MVEKRLIESAADYPAEIEIDADDEKVNIWAGYGMESEHAMPFTPAQAREFAKAILKAADEADPPEVKEGDTVRWIDMMLEGVVMNNAGHCDHLHVVVTRDDGSRRVYYIERHKVFKVSDG